MQILEPNTGSRPALHSPHLGVERAWLERVRWLARRLDAAWAIPGTKIRFGVESLLGLIPGAGDAVSAGISGYLVWEAHRNGASKWLIARMVGNILIDLTVGSIPLIGDLFDVVWKANQRNVTLIEKEFAGKHVLPRRSASEQASPFNYYPNPTTS